MSARGQRGQCPRSRVCSSSHARSSRRQMSQDSRSESCECIPVLANTNTPFLFRPKYTSRLYLLQLRTNKRSLYPSEPRCLNPISTNPGLCTSQCKFPPPLLPQPGERWALLLMTCKKQKCPTYGARRLVKTLTRAPLKLPQFINCYKKNKVKICKTPTPWGLFNRQIPIYSPRLTGVGVYVD